MHRLSGEKAFADVAVFQVDFDTSKELLREWKVMFQSTIIAWNGTTERARSTGETTLEAIRKLFQAAL